MKYKMLFTAECDMNLVKELESFCDVEYAGWTVSKTVIPEDELIARLRDKDILVTSYDKVTRRVLEESENLKLVVCGRANPVNVDMKAAEERGIKVSWTPGRNSDVTAEFAVALILNVARNVSLANRAIMSGECITDDEEKPAVTKTDVTWGYVKESHPYEDFKGPQIRNKTMGIIGYGSIGKRVGKIMHDGFGANLLIYDPFMSPVEVNAPGIRLVEFDELVASSDFISCHTKITPETTGLFNYDTFSKMKRTAYFINNSRGAIVNEDDLCRALRDKLIAGAALDVFAYEPLYKGHPFVSGELKNLLLTPHVSGASADAITNGTLMIVDSVKKFVKGM